MKYEVSTCVGCGLQPCNNCVGEEYECDECHEDGLSGEQVMCADILPNKSGHMCRDCFKEYIVSNPEALAGLVSDRIDDFMDFIWESV